MIVASCIHLLLSLVSEKPELSQEDPVRHALKFYQKKDRLQFFYITQNVV